MRIAFAYLAAFAVSLGTAAAQSSTSGSAAGSPNTTAPNTTTKARIDAPAKGGKSTTSTAQKIESGGQGHNATPSNGQIKMAPTHPSSRGGATGSTNQESLGKQVVGSTGKMPAKRGAGAKRKSGGM